MNPNDITGVILAGGQGRRMGGADKGLQLLAGRPLVSWVLERLKPQVAGLLISANRNLGCYAGFGFPVVTDTTPGYAGPLAGLQVAMARATTPLLLCAPCDSPHLPDDLAHRLRTALEATGADLVVPRAGGRVHRAFCLLRRDLQPRLDAFLGSGGRKLGLWHESVSGVEVDFEDEASAFGNFNSWADLSGLELAARSDPATGGAQR